MDIRTGVKIKTKVERHPALRWVGTTPPGIGSWSSVERHTALRGIGTAPLPLPNAQLGSGPKSSSSIT